MQKAIHPVSVPYMYDKAHKGAPYYVPALDKWLNLGEFAEVQLVYALTGEIRERDSVAYNEGSDVPELGLSIKCGRASLANSLQGATKEERLETFFSNVISTSFAYCVLLDGELVTYTMDRREFREFCEAWAYVEGAKLRLYKSMRVHRWCEDRSERRP